MSAHPIKQEEIAQALAQYVIRRDGLRTDQAHGVRIDSHCEILMLGEVSGPIFTVHLTAIPLSTGGES